MTDLSPAARAVWEAAMNTPDHMPYEYDIAAALRAAADQVVPDLQEPDWRASYMHCDIELYTAHQSKRSQLLAIAAELEGNFKSGED